MVVLQNRINIYFYQNNYNNQQSQEAYKFSNCLIICVPNFCVVLSNVFWFPCKDDSLVWSEIRRTIYTGQLLQTLSALLLVGDRLTYRYSFTISMAITYENIRVGGLYCKGFALIPSVNKWCSTERYRSIVPFNGARRVDGRAAAVRASRYIYMWSLNKGT